MIKKNALLIGGFVLGALALAVAAVLWLSGSGLFGSRLQALIHFEGGVAGLYVGAPVTFRGVPVGQVETIGIEVNPRSLDARIPVRVRLHPDSVRFAAPNGGEATLPDLAEMVQRGLRARLVAQSFVTGQKAVDLDFNPDAPPPPPPTTALPEIPAVKDRFDDLFDQVAQLPLRETVMDLRRSLQTLDATLGEVRSTLQGAQQTLGVTATELTAVARDSRRTLGAATATLEELRNGAATSFAATNRLLEATRQTVSAAQPELQSTLTSARAAAEDARVAVRRLGELAEPGAPLRSDLDAAVRDLSQAARGLREFSELLEEQPNAVLFGRHRE